MNEKDAKLEELKDLSPQVHQQIVDAGECWTTDEVTAEFEILGFMAPFCTAKRRSTGERGTLAFVHRPRLYYDWMVKS